VIATDAGAEQIVNAVPHPGIGYRVAATESPGLDPALDGIVNHFYDDVIKPYWPPERTLIDAHYATLDFPFDEIFPPAFGMEQDCTCAQVLAYLRTLSAVQRYRHNERRELTSTQSPSTSSAAEYKDRPP